MLTLQFRDVTRRIPHADPVAMELLSAPVTPNDQLGSFPRASQPQGLGFWVEAASFVTKAVPIIQGIIRNVQGGGGVSNDPVSAVWMALPASAVNARVGADGWWYDITTGQRLSHEEAALRQQQVVAGSISAHVGDDGWWYDNRTNQQLTHQDAMNRYDALVKQGRPMIGAPTSPAPTQPMSGAPGAPLVAGLSSTALVGLGVAALFVLPAILGKRRK